MKINVVGHDIDVKSLTVPQMFRYYMQILGETEPPVSEYTFTRRATTVESVKFLLNLMADSTIDIDEENCVEAFYDLLLFIEKKEVVLDGIEAYNKLMEK